MVVDGYEQYYLRQQTKVIVYNIPQKPAIDFLNGYKYSFIGDQSLLEEGYMQNFHLKPSRTMHRITQVNKLQGLRVSLPFVEFAGKKLLLIDKPYTFSTDQRIALDLIVVSRNPRLYIADLVRVFDCKQYVFDGSNSSWKIRQWKKDCDSLHLPNHSTIDKGAFIMDVKVIE